MALLMSPVSTTKPTITLPKQIYVISPIIYILISPILGYLVVQHLQNTNSIIQL